MATDKPKRKRSATLPIPQPLREPFYLAMWDMAWSGHFYHGRADTPVAGAFLQRFGSGSLVARRHGLMVLWLTAFAGRFNELAKLTPQQIDGQTLTLQRSKRGAAHMVQIDRELIEATAAWLRSVGIASAAATEQWAKSRCQLWATAMRDSQYLFPSVNGGMLNRNVFNRDVLSPLGRLFGFRLSSHCFRDTACQEAMRAVKRDAELDVRAVQHFLGHRSLQTTEHYLRKQREAQLCLGLFAGE